MRTFNSDGNRTLKSIKLEGITRENEHVRKIKRSIFPSLEIKRCHFFKSTTIAPAHKQNFNLIYGWIFLREAPNMKVAASAHPRVYIVNVNQLITWRAKDPVS